MTDLTKLADKVEGLTKAQCWALQAISERPGITPSSLGQRMVERPGVVRRGGNQWSHQGLGRIGGTMIARLKKMGLVSIGFGPITEARITDKGRRAMENDNDR
jgi:DNA-binding MarR family transcriptional regulator